MALCDRARVSLLFTEYGPSAYQYSDLEDGWIVIAIERSL